MNNQLQNPAPEEQFTAVQHAGETMSVELHEDAAIHEEEMNEEHSTLKYIHLEKEELLDVFGKLLETQPVEVLRREAEAIKSAFYKFVKQEQTKNQPEEETAGEPQPEPAAA